MQAQKHKDSLEGAYDHSKEYDPFKVNHRFEVKYLNFPAKDCRTSNARALVWSFLRLLVFPAEHRRESSDAKTSTCETIFHVRLLRLRPGKTSRLLLTQQADQQL